MANHMNEYINPLYAEDESPGTLFPVLCPQNIKFWRGMYCRFESGVHPREPLGDLLLATCDHSYSLEDHIKYLSKVHFDLEDYIIDFSIYMYFYEFLSMNVYLGKNYREYRQSNPY